MSEFPVPRFACRDTVMVYISDPAFAAYNGKIGNVLDTRWMNSKEAGERGAAGWQYQLSIPMDMMTVEGQTATLLWCAESMLHEKHEAGESFDSLMIKLKNTSPFLVGDSFQSIIESMKAAVPEGGHVDYKSHESVIPNAFCGCGRPARYIRGRADAPILSCNKYSRCKSVKSDDTQN